MVESLQNKKPKPRRSFNWLIVVIAIIGSLSFLDLLLDFIEIDYSLLVPIAAQIAIRCLPILIILIHLIFLDLKTENEYFAETDGDELEELEAPQKDEYLPTDVDAGNINAFIPHEFPRLLKKKSAAELKLGDHHQQEMTIFFSDIRQFTELFEELSPEEGFRFINSYLTRIVPVIEQYGGFVDKYIGDAVMALFPQSNGADMAVQAAIEIQNHLRDYNQHRAKQGYRPLEIGLGIHTGTLVLGVIGVHNRMQNTVISDAVNLASRIEGLTKAFGVNMAISGQTFQKLEHPEDYMFRYLGNVKVKGKCEPTRVYEVLNGADTLLMEKKMLTNRFFEQGLFSFVQKDYAEALDNFSKALEILPDDLASSIYLEHCREKLGMRS